MAACGYAGSLTASAQTQTSAARKAHIEAHKAQLANNKQRIDKSVINEFINKDIKVRESKDFANNALLSDLLSEANRHIGKRYVHGAKGPNQFDCSGFSSYVYRQFGYKISPSSRTQYTEGEAVSRKELKKGDLVFFTSRSSGKNVGHVGIVVSADNETGDFKFIHASLKGVKIDSCEGYYEGRYVGARRIIK